MTSALFQRNILRKLKYGLPPQIEHTIFFDEIICAEIDQICAYFGCEPVISRIDLLQAQEYWVDDVDSIRIKESLEADHLKHAGWLCHWLRKKRPISGLIIHEEHKLENYFEESYNEIVAFIIGLRIVIFYECCLRKLTKSQVMNIAARSMGAYFDMFPDIGAYLSHKNVSPHAIYLIYKSLMHNSIFVD